MSRLRLTQRKKVAEKDDIYTMNSERAFEPGRSFSYVPKATPSWLDWEQVRKVPELGPKEERNEMGFGEFKPESFKDSYDFYGQAHKQESGYSPSKQAKKNATVALLGKAHKCMKIAESLIPNLALSKVESLATALMNAENDLIDAAYKQAYPESDSKSSETSTKSATTEEKTPETQVVAKENCATESKSSESSKSANTASETTVAVAESKSSESSKSAATETVVAEEKKDAAFGLESKSSESKSAPSAPSAPQSTATVAATEKTAEPAAVPEVAAPVVEEPVATETAEAVEEEVALTNEGDISFAEEEVGVHEGSALNPEDDLFGTIFADGITILTEDDVKKEAAATKTASTKKGVAKLSAGPKESAYSTNFLGGIWKTDPDISHLIE